MAFNKIFWFKQYVFCIKYMGKYRQCHVRQDLTLSTKHLSKSFPVNQYEAHCLYNGMFYLSDYMVFNQILFTYETLMS